jgi:RNA polymerase sigma-70 factor, ECF subfamily
MTSHGVREFPNVGSPERPDSRHGDCLLMEGIRNGDRTCLAVLLERYWGALVTFAARIVDDRDVAQDVAQSTFIEVWRNRDAWTDTGTVSGYLYQVTRNRALNARRDQERRKRRQQEEAQPGPWPASAETPQETLEASDLRREVERALAALSERRREVFILARFHGLTHREISEVLGTSPQTVSNQMSAALSQLRCLLSHRLEPD